uniref:Uncharacterized protein n=1 Tax=Anguilla anguilla TaxID=7936 RepID=A0A0E9XCN8_ANGAN
MFCIVGKPMSWGTSWCLWWWVAD